MLTIAVPDMEFFDEKTNEFVNVRGTRLSLEHSLVAVSKWEAKYNKPFLGGQKRTPSETVYYIKCMTITQNVNDDVYNYLPANVIDNISNYINAPMTATTIKNTTNKKSSEVVTAELIYYWMIALNIPMECQKWHLNRLLTLIQVCNIKNQPPQKRNKKEMIAERNAINEQRRKQHNTKG